MDNGSNTIEFACMPACRKCRETGECLKQEAIDYAKEHRKAPYWPDSLAGTRMQCGCRVDIIPTVLGRLSPTHVWCVLHGWQPLTRKQAELDAGEAVPLF